MPAEPPRSAAEILQSIPALHTLQGQSAFAFVVLCGIASLISRLTPLARHGPAGKGRVKKEELLTLSSLTRSVSCMAQQVWGDKAKLAALVCLAAYLQVYLARIMHEFSRKPPSNNVYPLLSLVCVRVSFPTAS